MQRHIWYRWPPLGQPSEKLHRRWPPALGETGGHLLRYITDEYYHEVFPVTALCFVGRQLMG